MFKRGSLWTCAESSRCLTIYGQHNSVTVSMLEPGVVHRQGFVFSELSPKLLDRSSFGEAWARVDQNMCFVRATHTLGKVCSACLFQIWMYSSGAEAKLKANPGMYENLLSQQHDPKLVETIQLGAGVSEAERE